MNLSGGLWELDPPEAHAARQVVRRDLVGHEPERLGSLLRGEVKVRKQGRLLHARREERLYTRQYKLHRKRVQAHRRICASFAAGGGGGVAGEANGRSASGVEKVE